MIKYDNAHPNGIKILPDLRVMPQSPVAVRSMTEEERAYYGDPNPHQGAPSQVSYAFSAYLAGKLPSRRPKQANAWHEV